MSKKKKARRPLPLLPPGFGLVDSHCHLDMAPYDADRDEVVAAALAAGVSRMVTIGIDLTSSRRAVELAERFASVYAAVGVHPHHAAQTGDNDYQELARLAGHPKVVAYGEVGIDHVRGESPAAVQRAAFEEQVALAKRLGLPLIVHDREAHREIMEVLRAAAPFPAGGVMHCFSGDAALARQVVELGFFVSIPGVVTFKKADILQEAVRRTPLEWLLLETDAPYLAPEPFRGKRNDSRYLLYTAEQVADLKGIPLAEVARATTDNACRLFGFGAV